jgi:quercetin dioxygenase-like cupin family protein
MLKIADTAGRPDEALTRRPGWNDARISWLVDRQPAGAELGSLAVLEVEAGGGYAAHRHGVATVFVLEGGGRHVAGRAAAELAAGDVIHVGPGDWHGFAAGPDGVRVLVVYAPVEDVAGCELLDDGGAEPPAPTVVSLARTPDDPDLAEDQGWYGLSVKWLITDRSVGARAALLGASQFEPGGSHALHRHPVAEEILYIRDGGGRHLHETAARSPSRPGR